MNLKIKPSLITFAATGLLALAAGAASAAETACPAHFSGGQAPQITNQKMTVRARELCYSGFAVMHSGLTRTPLWSAEHLTREGLEAAAACSASIPSTRSRAFPPATAPNCATMRARAMTVGT